MRRANSVVGGTALERLSKPATFAFVYASFTEGFNTADLKEAKALLDELSWSQRLQRRA